MSAAPDNDDYEVEPPDAAVIANLKRHVREEVERAGHVARLDAIDDQLHGRADVEFDFSKWKIRYTTRDLLILMTVVALAISIVKAGGTPTLFILGSLVALGGTHAYLGWQENKKRNELMAERRKLVAQARGESIYDQPLLEEEEDLITRLSRREPLRMQFTRRDIALGLSLAVVACGLSWVISPVAVASLLGLLTVGGIVVYAAGFNPPAPLLAGWWLLLGLYLATSLFAAAWG